MILASNVSVVNIGLSFLVRPVFQLNKDIFLTEKVI